MGPPGALSWYIEGPPIMAEYNAQVRWQRGDQVFTDDRYSRAHTWTFDGGVEVRASSSPQVVPVPYSDIAAVDPEEAFIASLSSCHMLWFLSIAAQREFRVDSYVDDAVGFMGKDTAGRLAITRVVLRPHTTFSGQRMPTKNDVLKMHHKAHEACFIASSVKTDVQCTPRW